MPAIIECTECSEKFDVSGIPPGKAIKCASCKSVIEVPDFAALEAERKPKKKKKKQKDVADEGRGPTTRRRRKMEDKPRGQTDRRPRGKTTRRGGRGLPEPEKGGSMGKILAGLAVVALIGGAALFATSGGSGSGSGSNPIVADGSDAGSDVTPAGKSLQEEYQQRYRDAGDDLDALVGLAQWAGSRGLAKEHGQLLQRILTEAPNHEGANKALGKVLFDGKWVSKDEREQLSAKQKADREPFVKVLGEDMYELKTKRFHVFMQRSGFLETADEKPKFEAFARKMDVYFDGWFQRKSRELPRYSDGKLSDSDRSKLPLLRVALVTDQDAYAALADELAPRARREAGFHDAKTNIVWSFHNVMAEHPPFYDSFLFAVYTRPWDADKKRTPDEYIIWRKGHDAFGYLGIDVQVAVNEHWMVALQRGRYDAVETSRTYLAALEAAYGHFAKNYGDVMKTRGDMPLVPIYIFKDRAGYLRYGKKEGDDFINYTAGHYDPAERLMMTFRPSKGSLQDPINVLLHEGAHVLMHYLCQFRSPTEGDLFWLQEGVADFCAGYRKKKDGGFEVGVPNTDRIDQFKQFKRLETVKFVELMPLKKLLKFNLIDFAQMMRGPGSQRKKGIQMGVLYTQCWAFFHFLHHYKDGKYRPKLEKLMTRVLNKGSTYADFQAVFGSKLDIDAMEKELNAYMKTLTS